MDFKIGVVAFRVGQPVGDLLSEKFVHFYERVGRLVLGDEASALVNITDARTVPISGTAIRHPEELFRLASDGVSAARNRATHLLIDLANPAGQTLLPDFSIIQNVVAAITSLWWDEKPERLAVMLLPRPISAIEHVYKLLRDRIDQGQLVLIDNEGLVTGALPCGSLEASEYKASLMAVQEDPVTLLRRKMIRRIGHFRHNSTGRQFASRFFYDGHQCKNEMVSILGRRHSANPISQIILHAPLSPWLREAVMSFCYSTSVGTVPLDEDLTKSIPGDGGIDDAPLVVVAMVESGNTLRRIEELLQSVNAKCRPKYLAVMVTPAPHASEENVRRLKKDAGHIDVEYLMSVRQVTYEDRPEPMSVKEHSGSSFDIDEEPPNLTSYSFWRMIKEVGFAEEKNVPKSRRASLGMVPRFPDLFSANAPLIAYKLEKLLSRQEGGLPLDMVFVCPDEVGAIRLGDCISSMFNFRVVRIPRPVLDDEALKLPADGAKLHLARTYGAEEWFAQLFSAARQPDTHAILIDEFTTTGTTLLKLEGLCDALGIVVEQSVAIVDFRPEEGRHAGKLASLYRLPLGGSM